ncbi:unnamed protein product [Prorocentrum cordatum]|uniref:BZIP domain-containing protein n=1 Tax=Prorocentrum cordatum TaxID=2364126 RepID=A0ABN9W669_9DINO|nr:unnamed protein product [Polarella glacialis]
MERDALCLEGTPRGSSVESSDLWTSSSGSRSWADLSEDLWCGRAAPLAVPPGRGPAPEAPAARRAVARASGDELPSFQDRIADIPEIVLGEGGAAQPREREESSRSISEDVSEGDARKAKSALRRKCRQRNERRAEALNLNSATSLPVLQPHETPQRLPPPQYAPRTESASPQRPPAPPPTPRRLRHREDHDPDDSRYGGSALESTKVSL